MQVLYLTSVKIHPCLKMEHICFNEKKVCENKVYQPVCSAVHLTEIPWAWALKVCRLTFSLQLPWFPKDVFTSRTDSFLLSRQPETCHPCSPMILLLQSFGPEPWTLDIWAVYTRPFSKKSLEQVFITWRTGRSVLLCPSDGTQIHMPHILYKHFRIVIPASV